MKIVFRTLALAAAALALPGAAFAHPDPHLFGGGAAAGLAHPFTGIDHMLTMVAVGMWAGLLGGRARWLVPAAFVGVMSIGAVLGATGVGLPAVEPVIAVAIIVVGLLIAASVRVPTAIAMMGVAVFALFHGHAHGAEMPEMAAPLAYGLGFVTATVMLHGVGLFAAYGLRAAPRLLHTAGASIAAAGFVMMLSYVL